MAILAFQNLVYFAPQWFFRSSFTGDFVKTYHAVPHYVITAAQEGVGIDWIPVAGMGYPTALNLQSGWSYPPFWIFVLSGATYTLGAAIVLQCLTVLFGAIGCSISARLVGLTWGAALLAGVLFQSFGSFVLNSMHADLIRGFALAPWILAPILAAGIPRISPYETATLVMLPLNVLLLWTGGYPGVTVAVLVTAGSIAVLRAALECRGCGSSTDAIPGDISGWGGRGPARGSPARPGRPWIAAWPAPGVRRLVLALAGLLIGTLLAAPAIGPPLKGTAEIARSSLHGVTHDFAKLRDVFALIYDTDSRFFVGHDTTMKSLYIGVPAIALILSGIGTATPRAVRRLWPLVLIGIVMGGGLLTPLWTTVAPPLLYSRFPFSDYKVVFLLPLIMTAAAAFDRRHRLSPFAGFWLVCLVALGNGVFPMFGTETETSKSLLPPALRHVALAISCILTAGFLWTQAKVARPLALAAVISLVILDWSRIHFNHYHLALRGGVGLFESGRQFEQEGTPFGEQLARLRHVLRHPPARRPERVDIDARGYAWRGYYSGEYLMRDWGGPMQFVRPQRILASPEDRQFAAEPWTAVWLQPGAEASWRQLDRCDVVPREYGTDRVAYALASDTGGTYVVNELFYPGWRAVARNVASGETTRLEPRSAHGFRAYEIPAGEFEIIETFDMPDTRTWRMVSIIGLGLYGIFAVTMLSPARFKARAA